MIDAKLLGCLADVARKAAAYEDAQRDRSWRLGEPAGQALHEALQDLASCGEWINDLPAESWAWIDGSPQP